ncbi:MAG: ABC transporter permease [Gemmatimonadota bacterium]
MRIPLARRPIDYTRYGPLVALLVLGAISAVASPYFLKVQNLLNILRQVSYTGTIALGMTFVIIGGGIDLSVGSLAAMAGGLAILVVNAAGGGAEAIALGILTALAVGLAGGAANGFLVTRFNMAPFVVTLGTMSVYRSLTLYFIDAGEYRSLSDAYAAIGAGKLLGIFVPVWLFLGLAALFQVVLTRTRYGRYVLAVGASEQVARYSAIKVRLVRFGTYALTGFTVGVTAVMFGSRLNAVSSSNMGLYYEMDAIAAVVIGGTSMAGGAGTVLGTVLGAIILGIINNMLNMMGVSPYLQGTVKGLVIILAVLFQYRGSRNK